MKTIRIISIIAILLSFCSCQSTDPRERQAIQFIKEKAGDSAKYIEEIELVKVDSVLSIKPLLDAEIEYYKASTEVEQSNAKIKALDIISDMGYVWNAMEGVITDAAELKRIKNDPSKEWRIIYRFKVKREGGRVLDIDVIFNEDGTIPDMTGSSYMEVVTRVERYASIPIY